MTDHVWVHENLDSYLAGDMTTGEREKVERHIDVCDTCKHALAEAHRVEQMFGDVFVDAKPSATLDDRVIENVRNQALRSVKMPMAWRIAGAAAAVLVIGMVGWVAQTLTSEGGPFPEANNLTAPLDAAKTTLNAPSAAVYAESKGADQGYAKELAAGYSDDKLKSLADGLTVEQKREVAAEKTETVKVPDGGKGERGGGAAIIPTGGAGKTNTGWAGKEFALERRESFFGTTPANKAPAFPERPLLNTFDTPSLDPMKATRDTKDVTKLEKVLEESMKKGDKGFDGEKLKLSLKVAQLDTTKFFPQTTTLPTGPANIPGTPTFPPALMPVPSISPPPPGGGVPPFPPVDPGSFAKKKGGANLKEPPKRDKEPTIDDTNKEGNDKRKDDYFKPQAKNEGDQGKVPALGDGKGNEPKPEKKPAVEAKPKVEDSPADTGRKIIRTGEMEFEIESFYSAIDTITLLITGDVKNGKTVRPPIRGGFIATSNSEKLPNGKMRGSIVVRMPPEYLDKFVFDLRSELGKTGELKNQRIISLDVTKQYTDIESRLRAARTMEERLIQIIKIGKGEIKDLIAAERELGIWRTKIEEMEGEIRYYSNQVSLSTLTIQLSEKEILAPTALVLTENVRMRLEVDNVGEAHQAAIDLVEEVKGSLTKSELKLHPGGQLQSIMQAEIPPAKKDEFTKKLKKLGIPSDIQESQFQHTEGGVGKPGGLKQRKGDVRFDITMFNNANIRPRLAVDMKVATADVPGDYAKILDKIAKVNGQVRDAKLNEHDKLNINASIDFNVPIAEKPAIDKILFDIGPVLERASLRAPFSELSTERKFGYTIVLRDFASIPPSKSAHEVIATTDVPTAYAKLQEAIAKAKGLIIDAKVNEEDKLNINAQVDFSIPSEEIAAFEKLIKELGTSLSRTNMQAPMKQLTTARKFGYSLALRDFASIPPSKSAIEVIATTDVPATYARLQEAITKIKGQIIDAKVNEQEKLNINAQLDFSIPTEEVVGFEKLLKELGTSLSRTNVQAPMKMLTTARKFGYTLALRDFASVPASKVLIETIAVKDVPVAFLKLQNAIASTKGLVIDAKLNEQDKLNVNAQVDFTVMVESKPAIDLLLKELGYNLTRTNVQAPVNSLSTEKKFGYMLVLRDYAVIPASKTTEMRIATNDLPTTYAKLLDEIKKAEGHVSHAKLNEQDKLNTTALVSFSVPIEAKDSMDKLLKEIGPLLTRNNSETPMNHLSIAKKFGYTVELSDFASIRPSHYSAITIAASNVPGNYAKLMAAILAAKGQVHDGKLNEQDKLNITGVIDFSVPTDEKAAIEKLLGEIGTGLSRKNDQTAANILSTDRKFGYAVTLRDFANIPPRETFILQVAMRDVPATFRELQEAVVKAKGWVSVGNLKEDKAKVEAQFDFDVPAAERRAIEKVLAQAGAIVTRTTSQVPVDKMATDQKVGFAITLHDFANIPARETFILQIAMHDVPATFRELQDVVAKAKGWVSVNSLKEDKAKIEAQLDFDVPASETASVERLLAKAGAIVSRNSKQIPTDKMATDSKVGYQLSLRSTASIGPREKTLIKFETGNVDEDSAKLKDLVLAGKGRIVDSTVDRQENGQVTSLIIFEVPLSSQDSLVAQMKVVAGKLVSQRTTHDTKVPVNDLTTAHIIVTLNGSNPIVPSDEGVTSYVRTSLYLSFKILAIIVMSLIVGLSAIVPCAIMIAVGFKLYGAVVSSNTATPAPVMESGLGDSKPVADDGKPHPNESTKA